MKSQRSEESKVKRVEGHSRCLPEDPERLQDTSALCGSRPLESERTDHCATDSTTDTCCRDLQTTKQQIMTEIIRSHQILKQNNCLNVACYYYYLLMTIVQCQSINQWR